jgi:hypothetical protein
MNRLPLFVLIFLVVACIDTSEYEIDQLEANPDISVPLGFGALAVQDLISDSQSDFIKVAADGLLYLQYSEELRSTDIRNLFDIPNKNINRAFVLPRGVYPAINRDVRLDSITEIVDLNLAPEKLSEILLKSGRFEYQTSSTPTTGLSFVVQASLPDITKNNVPINVAINNVGSGNVSLTDYVMKLNQNRFTLKLVLILRSRTQPVTLNTNVSVNFRAVFQSLDFRWIKGFFGDQSAALPEEELAIAAFGNSLLNANVSFAEPKVELLVTNEYSVPARVDFVKLEARKANQVLPVQLNPPNPINLAFPASPGGSAVTNTNITNTKELLDFAPTSFYYKANARINAGISSGSNFLADTSKLKVRLNVEVPFFGRATNINLADTLDIDLSDLDASRIDSTFFRIQAINELPLEADLQFYFANDKAVVFDSLFAAPEVFVKSSTVNALGDLQAPGQVSQRKPIPTAKINQLLKAKKIIIRAVLNTSRASGGSQPDVKFRSNYRLQLNLGLQSKLKLNVRL